MSSNLVKIVVSSLLFISASADADDLKVIELFTSQGCYSCPAADKLIAELAAKDDSVLNLEYHVDYWNKLVYGSEGVWVDPFSSAEYTERQRQYAGKNLRGNNGVYTPQAVINGVYGQVGSDRRAVNKSLNTAAGHPVSIDISRKDDATLLVNISGDVDEDAGVYLVNFLKETQTTITSGENHDKIMDNHNVVTDMKVIARLSETGGEPLQVAYSGGENRGCAILVQKAQYGAMLGAARCP